MCLQKKLGVKGWEEAFGRHIEVLMEGGGRGGWGGWGGGGAKTEGRV